MFHPRFAYYARIHKGFSFAVGCKKVVRNESFSKEKSCNIKQEYFVFIKKNESLNESPNFNYYMMLVKSLSYKTLAFHQTMEDLC